MVVGKNTTQSVKLATTQKLPPLKKLAVKRPDMAHVNPCLSVMSSVLGCWASNGYTTAGCAALEESLRACMDARRSTSGQKNNINSHLARFYPRMIGPHKRK